VEVVTGVVLWTLVVFMVAGPIWLSVFALLSAGDDAESVDEFARRRAELQRASESD
jgi:hypothetical protein